MAFIYRRELKGRNIFILMPYLVVVFIQETSLAVFGELGYIPRNALVYNIYRPLSVIVFAVIYYTIPVMHSVKRLVAGLTLVYLFLVIINYCFVESIFTTSSYLTLARGVLITFYAVVFLFRYFNIDNPEVERFWRPLLWITAGIAFFYPVVTTSLTFQKYLEAEHFTLYGLRIYQVIPQLMSIFMYSCFSYAFYLCRKIK